MGAAKAMASRLIKCPRCQATMDVGNMAPGSTVRCTDCGGMARIPSGRTGMNPAVQAPVAAPPPPALKKEGGTRTRVRSISSTGLKPVPRLQRRKSNTGLVVGLVVALLAVVGILLAVLMSGKEPPPPVVKSGSRPPSRVEEPALPPPERPVPAAPDASGPPKPPSPVGRAEDASKARWDDLMTTLRAGGAFDDFSRPEGVAFKRVKDMGKEAYPHLIRYIDHEDPLLGRAAVAVLNELTGQKKPLPNDTTKTQVKAEWEAWVKANP